MTVAAVTVCAALPLLSALGLQRTFVPYFLEVAFAVGLLLCCSLLDSSRRAWPALLVLVVATPLFTISPLFLLPGVAVHLLWWAHRSPIACDG